MNSLNCVLSGFGHSIGSLLTPVNFSAAFDTCQEELDKNGMFPYRPVRKNCSFFQN